MGMVMVWVLVIMCLVVLYSVSRIFMEIGWLISGLLL